MSDNLWTLANQVIQGKLTTEEAVNKLPNKKAARDFLVQFLRSAKAGKMKKSYEDEYQNVMDKMVGRQSQIRPANEHPLRAYGLDNPTICKSMPADKACKACGSTYKAIKDTDGCPRCAKAIKDTKWHKGNLG